MHERKIRDRKVNKECSNRQMAKYNTTNAQTTKNNSTLNGWWDYSTTPVDNNAYPHQPQTSN